jgi:hypothetical protein
MVKMGVAVFATPHKRKLFALRPRISQQGEIATSHQLEAGARQTNGAVAQLVCLPAGTGRNSGAAEQDLRNGAISFTGQAAVERAQRKPKPVTPLAGEAIGWTAAWSARCDAPEA